MKKCFLFLALSLGLVFQGFTQVKIGTKLGATFANLYTSASGESLEGSGQRLSAYGGITVDLPVTNKLTFQPGLLLVGKGSKSEEQQSVSTGNNKLTVTAKSKIAPLYLELPLNFLYNFQWGKAKFAAGFGPYYAIGLGGKYEFMITETREGPGYSGSTGSEGRGKITYGSEGNINRHDVGINGSLSYLFNENLGIQTGYGLGLTRVYPDREFNEDTDAKTRNAVFSLGFIFKY